MPGRIPKTTTTTGSNLPATSTTSSASTTGSAPTVTVTKAPIGPKSDVWEGVGTHSNTSAHEKNKGIKPLTPAQIAAGEQQIENLHPQITRTRVDANILHLQDPSFKAAHPDQWKEAKAQRATLDKMVEEALQHGGRVDLCLWSLPEGKNSTTADLQRDADRYAKLVKQIVDAHPNLPPGTFMVSAQNEPNRTFLSPAQVVTLFQSIDASLKKTLGPQGRANVKLVAGELTGADQSEKWIHEMVPKLGNTVDAFSFHMYYGRKDLTIGDFENRLRAIRQQVNAEMPTDPKTGKKKDAPELLLTEYGVKGDNSVPGKRDIEKGKDRPGDIIQNGKRVSLREVPEGAFREAQILIAASRTGYSGAMRWGSTAGGTMAWQSWSMTGTADEGTATKKPAYHLTNLFTHAVGQGWRAVQTNGSVAGESIASFRAPTGLGTASIAANEKSTHQRIDLAGFPAKSAVRLLVWNAKGDGKLTTEIAHADAKGVVAIDVPPRGVVAATTRLQAPTI